MSEEWGSAVEILKSGGLVVAPTDTLYGVLASASDPLAVEKVYELKKRNPDKPLIVLLHDPSLLEEFGVALTPAQQELLLKNWPGKVSIVFDCDPGLEYLHRGTNSLAFRMPQNQELLDLLAQTGPLVAPSANPEGEEPAATAEEARVYFKEGVDLYLDGATLTSRPSKLVDARGTEIKILRE